MAEYKLFEGTIPYVSTFEYHEHRDRAPHLEQVLHRDRLLTAAAFVNYAADLLDKCITVSDLGCGDGGLLSIIQDYPSVQAAWGYDFQPANAIGWRERGVRGIQLDAFGADMYEVEYGDVCITTEVLEHLADPHRVVEYLATKTSALVASSPWTETAHRHSECHAWAWDIEGYAALFETNGWRIVCQEQSGPSQIVLAVPA